MRKIFIRNYNKEPGFSSRVDNVINGLKCKVESHEFNYGSHAIHGHSNSNSSEPSLSDWGIHNFRVSMSNKYLKIQIKKQISLIQNTKSNKK
jgi:hypothetical protein